MISSITKPKIPKAYSYVLKTSQIQELIEVYNIKTPIDLVYRLSGSVLEAHFWLPNDNIPYCRIYLRAGALLYADAKKAREQLANNVFPVFGKWVGDCEKLANDSIKMLDKPFFDAKYSDVDISLSYHVR